MDGQIVGQWHLPTLVNVQVVSDQRGKVVTELLYEKTSANHVELRRVEDMIFDIEIECGPSESFLLPIATCVSYNELIEFLRLPFLGPIMSIKCNQNSKDGIFLVLCPNSDCQWYTFGGLFVGVSSGAIQGIGGSFPMNYNND